MKYIKHKKTPAIKLKNYPCQTQAAERCVNLVKDAARAEHERTVGISANNTITRSVDSRCRLLVTIFRPHDKTIKSTRLPTTKLKFQQFIN